MTTIYSGNPANVSSSLTRSISGCANNGSGAIRVTTSTSHLFSSFDVVIISGISTGTTEANGTWVITVIDATHFDLVGSTFTNAYVSGGSAVDNSLTPAATLPTDGEQCTAETVLAALQLLLDRTQFLATHALASTLITIAPTPFNISYARDWIVGDNGTATADGPRLVKAVANDNPVLFDISAYVTPLSGRRLASVTSVIAIGQSHASVPAILPTMRLYRTQSLSTTGVAPAADQSLLAATDAPFPTPGSGAAYYASGHLQSWTLTTDQNNVIDASRRYYVVLIDESGSNSAALNSYFGLQLTVN